MAMVFRDYSRSVRVRMDWHYRDYDLTLGSSHIQVEAFVQGAR